MATWTTPLVILSVCLLWGKKKKEWKKEKTCFALADMEGFSIMRRAPSCILFHSGAPAELSLLYSDDSFIIRPFIQILNLNGYFCFTHKDTGTSLCAFDIFHVLVLSKISWPVLLSVWYSLFYIVCVRVYVHGKKKENIKCFQTSLYSDALLSSCSRRRRQRTKCTPTCIISAASPLVTSPFPQALSSLTALSKIVS